MTTGTRMQQRRDTAANWTTVNPVLSAGELGLETDTKLTKWGDGSTHWNSLPYQESKVLYSAAGDILVATGSHAAARLAKGTDGQYLTMASGAVAWVTPPATDLTSTVALDGSRTITGNQTMAKSDPKLLLSDNTGGASTDRVQLYADTGTQYLQVDDELHITSINGTIASPRVLRAGALYDTGNRVYSLSNPPPGVAAVPVLGYNAHVWQPDASDRLVLTGATYSPYTQGGMVRTCTQTAAAGALALPAAYAGVPRLGYDQTSYGTIMLEGTVVRTATTVGEDSVGMGTTLSATIHTVSQWVGFQISGATGDVKALTATASTGIGQLITASNGTQRGSTISAGVPLNTPKRFKITVTAAGVVTFVFDGSTVYTGSLSITLYDAAGLLALVANQKASGASAISCGSFLITYA